MLAQDDKLERLLTHLEAQFPQYSIRRSRRVYGACLIVRKSAFHGADVFLQDGGIVIEPSIPDTWARVVLGAGAVLLKGSPSYQEAATLVGQYLTQTGFVVRHRA